jgi:catechol 2,3-dioxygenase-like lactoylglutathione lyase family enzyme
MPRLIPADEHLEPIETASAGEHAAGSGIVRRTISMSAKPKFAHVVFHTSQAKSMRDWYCKVLDAHVVYEDDALTFVTFDEEHHRIALINSPDPLERKTPATAAHVSPRSAKRRGIPRQSGDSAQASRQSRRRGREGR